MREARKLQKFRAPDSIVAGVREGGFAGRAATCSGSRSRARSGSAKGDRGGTLCTVRAGNPSQSATTLPQHASMRLRYGCLCLWGGAMLDRVL
jgi:hypothetical protein